MQQKLLELDIQKLQFVIENNEKKIAEQLEKVKNKQIGKVSQQAKPKIVEIKEQEKKLKKKLSGLNEELGKRRALEDVLMKNMYE